MISVTIDQLDTNLPKQGCKKQLKLSGKIFFLHSWFLVSFCYKTISLPKKNCGISQSSRALLRYRGTKFHQPCHKHRCSGCCQRCQHCRRCGDLGLDQHSVRCRTLFVGETLFSGTNYFRFINESREAALENCFGRFSGTSRRTGRD